MNDLRRLADQLHPEQVIGVGGRVHVGPRALGHGLRRGLQQPQLATGHDRVEVVQGLSRVDQRIGQRRLAVRLDVQLQDVLYLRRNEGLDAAPRQVPVVRAVVDEPRGLAGGQEQLAELRGDGLAQRLGQVVLPLPDRRIGRLTPQQCLIHVLLGRV
jgi:hypothetical protein